MRACLRACVCVCGGGGVNEALFSVYLGFNNSKALRVSMGLRALTTHTSLLPLLLSLLSVEVVVVVVVVVVV